VNVVLSTGAVLERDDRDAVISVGIDDDRLMDTVHRICRYTEVLVNPLQQTLLNNCLELCD
jgi:hypothetical protein